MDANYIATASSMTPIQFPGGIKSDYERQWKQSGSTSSFNAWLLNDLKQNGIRRGTKYININSKKSRDSYKDEMNFYKKQLGLSEEQITRLSIGDNIDVTPRKSKYLMTNQQSNSEALIQALKELGVQ